MTHFTDMSDENKAKARAFMAEVLGAGGKHGFDGSQVIYLFGRMTRILTEYAAKKENASPEQAAAEAVEIFLQGGNFHPNETPPAQGALQ